jgi:hypothetical protein
MNLDISVGTATGYRLDGRDSIPSASKFSLYSTATTLALVLIEPSIQWIPGVLSRRVKRPGCEAGDSPSSVEDEDGKAKPPFTHASSWCGAKLIRTALHT